MRQIGARKPPNSNRLGKLKRFAIVLPLLAFLIAFLILSHPASFLDGLIKPISVFSQITGAGKLASSDNRTNILILGSDRRYREPGLTDTMIVASVDARSGQVALFSIPRDVWIKNYHSKINALYAIGGIDTIKKVAGEILDLPIHYYVALDFGGFERAIDAVGGVEITVERDFEDFLYPIPGREADDCGGGDPEHRCRYETLIFKKGLQKMDGKTALKFSRSRQSTGPEGSDFARALRQQKVIIAFKDQVLSLRTLVNPATLSKLFDEYRASVETNIGLLEVERFYSLSTKLKDENVRSYVINKNEAGEDILYTPADFTPFDGQWILLPRASDFSEVRALVQKVLFGEP